MLPQAVLLLALSSIVVLPACESEDINPVDEFSEVNEDGVKVPDPVAVEIDLEFVDGLVRFETAYDVAETLEAFNQYNGSDIERWVSERGTPSLASVARQYENKEFDALPEELSDQFFSYDPEYKEVILDGINANLATMLSPEGILVVDDRAMYVSYTLQAAADLDQVDALIKAVEQDDFSDERVDLLMDERSTAAVVPDEMIAGRADRIVGVNGCGTNAIAKKYSYQHRDGNRRHAMYYVFWRFNSPRRVTQSGVTGYAWQMSEIQSISYKGRSRKYKTEHHMSMFFTFDTFNSRGGYVANGWLSDYGTAYGKDVTRNKYLCVSNEYCPISDRASLQWLARVDEVFPGSGTANSSSSTGTWGNHRGMGSDHKIRFECL